MARQVINTGSALGDRTGDNGRVAFTKVNENFEELFLGGFHPQTSAEISAGVTPTSYQYEPGDVRRYGAVGDGVADDTAAIQQALDVERTVFFPDGDYRCVGLSGSVNSQRLIATGRAFLIKNGNGDLFTHSGADLVMEGIDFRGDASTPTFTGHNVVLTGERPTLINCASQWAYDVALKATKNRVRVLGSCGVYQTALGDYDIEVGTSGVATIYHVFHGFNSSQSTGGIHLIDTGSAMVSNCQFGKLFIESGTSPSGSNAGMFTNNRILGAIDIEISNGQFSNNQFGAIAITIGTGVSGVVFDVSNAYGSGHTVTNNGNDNNVIVRQVAPGSTINLQFGDDSSAAILEINPTATGSFEFNKNAIIKNGQAVVLEGTSGTNATLAMSGSNNASFTNNVSGAAFILTQAGAGTVNFDINGTRSGQFDSNSTAGNTRFLLWDVDGGALRRVKSGANGTGPGGVGRALYIDNA